MIPSKVAPRVVRAAASARTPGFDVARALAIFGMLLVNFRAFVAPDDGGPAWIELSIDRTEGKAAALFVVLAGVGVSLRARAAKRRKIPVVEERRALLRRALVLFVLGLIDLHLWEWDILHCYGVFLFLAAWLFDVRSAGLWGVALLCTVIASVMQANFDYEAPYDFWEGGGALADLGFNGLFPVFPWFAFFAVGMVIGRLDLHDAALRRRWLVRSLVIGLVVELWSWQRDPFEVFENGWDPSSTWPRPAGPAFVVVGVAFAIAAICACIEITERRLQSRWVLALTATGQLALTIYIAHAVAILMPLDHGFFEDGELLPVLGYAIGFYAVAVLFSLRWRVRYRYGPLELLVRQLAAPKAPTPWGGVALAEVRDAKLES